MTVTCFAHKNVGYREKCNTQIICTLVYYTLSIYNYVNYINKIRPKIRQQLKSASNLQLSLAP